MMSIQGSSEHNPPPQSPFSHMSWADIKGRMREIVRFLPRFLKNPVEGIRSVPSWDWSTVILLEILLSMVTGFLAGIFSRSFLAIIFGLVAAPIMGVILSFILAGIFYYAFLFIMRTEIEYRKIFVIVVLAKIPSQILGILYPLVNFITLFSIIVTALLLIVGLTENFRLKRKDVSKIVGVIAGLSMLFWLYSTIVSVTSNRIKVQEITPDSLNQIHKEMGETK